MSSNMLKKGSTHERFKCIMASEEWQSRAPPSSTQKDDYLWLCVNYKTAALQKSSTNRFLRILPSDKFSLVFPGHRGRTVCFSAQCAVRHISSHSVCGWCCMCFDGRVQIVFACLSPPMDHMGWGNHSCEREAQLHHTSTLTSFLLHIGVPTFVWLPSTHETLHTSLFLRGVILSSSVLLTENHPSKPRKPSTFPQFCTAYLPSLSQPGLSPEHHLYWDFTPLPVDFIVASIFNSTLWSSINTIPRW